jgi:hypothetical protein
MVMCLRVRACATGWVMPALLDRPRLCRLFAFIREHQEEARRAEDWVRAYKFEALGNKLLDYFPR